MAATNTELAQMTSIQEQIADRIRRSFVELIPEDQWKALVQKEIDEFMTPTREHYSSEPRVSPLRQLIRKTLSTMFEAMLKDELAKPEYAISYNRTTSDGKGVIQPSEAVKKIILESLPELMAAQWGAVIQSAVTNMRNMRFG